MNKKELIKKSEEIENFLNKHKIFGVFFIPEIGIAQNLEPQNAMEQIYIDAVLDEARKIRNERVDRENFIVKQKIESDSYQAPRKKSLPSYVK